VSVPLALLGGAAFGIVAGSLLVPVTRRALAASVARSVPDDAPMATTGVSVLRIDRRHRIVLAVASGLLPALVLSRAGWSPTALPPLLLLVGLVQLAYCDLTRRLLPKTLVYALTGAVIASGVTVAACTGDWHRLQAAFLGSLACFALFFVLNLMNPRWMAFGDVRLSLVFGFGLAWVSPMALFQAFLYANLLAAGIGLALVVARRADRRSDLPFGLYMALGAGLVLFAWS
jgi:leader peptidase (prepilin peptidase) / N-methyltransferase